MNLVKHYKIKDVIFKTHNIDGIFYIKKTKNINSLFKFLDSETLIIKESDLEKVLLHQEKLVLLDEVGKPIKFLKKTEKKYSSINIPKELVDIRISKSRDEYIYYFERTQPRKFGVTDLKNKIFETTVPNFYWIFSKKKVFYFINEFITCYSDKNQLSWQHDLSKLNSQISDKFHKFLGIAHDKLFVLSEQNRIIVLDINNGSILKSIHSEEFPDMTDSFMHPESLNIYCLSNTFVKVNSKSLEIETLKKITKEKINPETNTNLYGIKDSSYQDKYISFTSYTSFKSGHAKWIGLFDYNIEEIVWHYELLDETNSVTILAFESPQLAGDKLYVLDSENTLHILELHG
ncbi:hypothetical protein [Flavobacterium sp.]|uniref:hypothetical protein n=1 Tax=Flavobacterium sp. TaxID=239 RepID=UPI002EDB9BBC